MGVRVSGAFNQVCSDPAWRSIMGNAPRWAALQLVGCYLVLGQEGGRNALC